MKKFTLFATLVLIGSAMTYAQQYQTYFSNRTIAFGKDHTDLKFQKVDSIQISQEDSVFWFFPNFDVVDYWCLQPNGPNWSGRKVIIKENGDNVFFNRYNDSILIKTHEKLYAPWLAYDDTENYKIFAEVINHDTLSFLGLTDSVKTIGFQVYDVNNDSIDHALNNRHLKLSRNYGLIKTFLFRDFPNYWPTWPRSNEYEIRGISSPELGIQNLTWKDVFDDFYPGDELHVMAESCYGDIFDTYCGKQNSIFKYLDRIDYQDSLKYTTERISSSKSIHNDVVTGYEYTHDTITSVIRFHPDMNFNKLSEEAIIEGDVISYNLQSKKHFWEDKYVMTKTVKLYDHLERISENCWEPYLTGHYFLTDYEYMKGLGGPYYWGMMDGDNYARRRLVYYKKGDETWGSPLTIDDETGIESVNEPMISVFPNPAQDFIMIRTDIAMPALFEVIDLHGSVLIAEQIDSKHDQIDTSGLKAGIYIYRVRKGELVYQTGKLLIE
jgi:hypothetical protein